MRNEDVASIENLQARADVFILQWRVTMLCNYQCEFCIQGDRSAHRRQTRGESAETRSAICEQLRQLLDSLQGYRAVNVALIGGEVTIPKEFPALLEHLAGSSFAGDIAFQITTNLSRSADFYAALCDIVRKRDRAAARRTLHLSASYYAAYVSHEDFSDKLHAIASHLAQVSSPFGIQQPLVKKAFAKLGLSHAASASISIGHPILSDADYQHYLAMQAAFNARGINVNPIIIGEFETSLSPSVQQALALNGASPPRIKVTDCSGNEHMFFNIQALGAALEDRDKFCPRGYLCDAGMQSIFVDALGNIYRCPTLGETLQLGSVLDPGWRLHSHPVICISDHCSCNKYGRIQKP